MGPLPITRGGNRHIIVSVDYFSKLFLAQPVPTCAAGSSTDEVINRYGVYQHIVSDQGTAFTSGAWRDTLSSLGITHTLATTERPQTNGLVERQNAVVIDQLAAFVRDRESWDEGLPSAVFAINTDVHSATKFSPFEVLFGFHARLLVETDFPWPEDSDPEVKRDCIWSQVRQNILADQARQTKHYDAKHREVEEYCPGDLVTVRRKQLKKEACKKLSHRNIGPFQVVQKLGPKHLRGGRHPDERQPDGECLMPT
jgi:hypothetical protein